MPSRKNWENVTSFFRYLKNPSIRFHSFFHFLRFIRSNTPSSPLCTCKYFSPPFTSIHTNSKNFQILQIIRGEKTHNGRLQLRKFAISSAIIRAPRMRFVYENKREEAREPRSTSFTCTRRCWIHAGIQHARSPCNREQFRTAWSVLVLPG